MNKHYSEYETNMAAVFVWEGISFSYEGKVHLYVLVMGIWELLRTHWYKNVSSHFLLYTHVFFRTQDFDMDSFNG